MAAPPARLEFEEDDWWVDGRAAFAGAAAGDLLRLEVNTLPIAEARAGAGGEVEFFPGAGPLPFGWARYSTFCVAGAPGPGLLDLAKAKGGEEGPYPVRLSINLPGREALLAMRQESLAPLADGGPANNALVFRGQQCALRWCT